MIRFGSTIDDYRKFLRVRQCPQYHFRGRAAVVPADRIEFVLGSQAARAAASEWGYSSSQFLYDYQRGIAELAIQKRKYAVFADCGLGKTLILLEYARHVANVTGQRVLIVSPLMVVEQTIGEAKRWYRSQIDIGRIRAGELQAWIDGGDGPQIACTNYEAIVDGIHGSGELGGLILDESSMLKSHYGKWGTRLIELGRGLDWKLCCTGTPAPNDRIEYANHAVFLDRSKTVNEFLATYFINRGQTQNRWELKPHALRPFYRSLSDWSIFLTNPATYGWQDNTSGIPPIHIHIEDVPLTDRQKAAAMSTSGELFTANPGGITQRSKLSQIAKATDSLKPQYIRDRVASWPDEGTIVWCHYNQEQSTLEKVFGEFAVSIEGKTKEVDRLTRIETFKAGGVQTLITKPKILGFGLNLQVATRQVFSGIKDSYEEFYQAVKRSNRIGSTQPLNVHIPVTELEVPFVENVLRKSRMVEEDTRVQEELFRDMFNV